MTGGEARKRAERLEAIGRELVEPGSPRNLGQSLTALAYAARELALAFRELGEVIERLEELEEGGTYIHGRCPECGHRLRQDLPASGCPQCGATFGSTTPLEYPEACECDRCEAVRAGREEWSDPTEPAELEADSTAGDGQEVSE